MDFPEFFDKAPVVSLRDPLAVFLGASGSGKFTYSYADAVKLAGHSCPTVAGAYLMVRRGWASCMARKRPSAAVLRSICAAAAPRDDRRDRCRPQPC